MGRWSPVQSSVASPTCSPALGLRLPSARLPVRTGVVARTGLRRDPEGSSFTAVMRSRLGSASVLLSWGSARPPAPGHVREACCPARGGPAPAHAHVRGAAQSPAVAGPSSPAPCVLAVAWKSRGLELRPRAQS